MRIFKSYEAGCFDARMLDDSPVEVTVTKGEIWINTNDGCLVRVKGVKELHLQDWRKLEEEDDKVASMARD